MPLTLKFVGAIRQSSGKAQITVNLQGYDTLKSLVLELSKDMPELQKIFGGFNDPSSNSLVLINGREISVLNGLDTKLKDGDEVVFIPVIHGG